MLCEILSVMVVVVCVRSYIIYVYCVYIGRYWVLTRVYVCVFLYSCVCLSYTHLHFSVIPAFMFPRLMFTYS